MQNELFQARPEPNRLIEWQPSDWPVAAGWGDVVSAFLNSETGRGLGSTLQSRLAAGAAIYPSTPFKALELTPLAQVRVVILGQDPYHGAGQAEGLAFSVAPGVKIPPSLRNIFKEIQLESGKSTSNNLQTNDKSGSLKRWAAQGVLLLNTCLTVEEGLPASHAKWGWEVLTDALIQQVAQCNKNVVFMLWGAHAQAKEALLRQVDQPSQPNQPNEGLGGSLAGSHLVLKANHPSPLSALRPPVPFLGCNHFSLANSFLQEKGLPVIHW